MCTKWTEEEKQILENMWNTHYARDIAKVLNKTKGSVIGMANRMKLEKGGRVEYESIRDRTVKIRPVKIKENKSKNDCTRNDLKHILELKPNDCRFPIGHPGQKRFGFCGRPQKLGRPYCLEHCNIAYRRE